MANEQQMIQKIARLMQSRRGKARADGLRVGIGDDAAVFAPQIGKELVLSCDAFLEGVHFLSGVQPPEAVGYKALVRAASDLAAMGARPQVYLLSLAIPAAKTSKWLDAFLHGMRLAEGRLGIRLAGGDTTKSGKVAICITVAGDVAFGRSVRRSGAREGDHIYVSGRLGGAELGLRLLRSGLGRRGALSPLVRRHFYPPIRTELGRWLAERGIASAMMDLSDGLSVDLPKLAAASGVGARIWSERIPRMIVPAKLAKRLRGLKIDALQLALHGGDDYELLFTLPRRKEELLRGAPGGAKLTAIGEVTLGKRITLVDSLGKERPLAPHGWDPFV